MRLTTRLTFLAALTFMFVSAYAQDVHYNYNRGTNFQSYKTYKWVDLPDGVSDQLIDESIKRAIDEQLAQKGLTKVDGGKDADLQIGYHAIITAEKGLNLSGTRWGGWGGGLGGWSDASVQGQTSTIPVGTLLVDIYDPGAKQLIWRGDVTKTVDLKKDPDKNYKALQKAMAKLFKNYPPQAKK
jgi:hypothetical protein